MLPYTRGFCVLPFHPSSSFAAVAPLTVGCCGSLTALREYLLARAPVSPALASPSPLHFLHSLLLLISLSPSLAVRNYSEIPRCSVSLSLARSKTVNVSSPPPPLPPSLGRSSRSVASSYPQRVPPVNLSWALSFPFAPFTPLLTGAPRVEQTRARLRQHREPRARSALHSLHKPF